MDERKEVAEFAQRLTALQRQLFVYLTTLIGRTTDVEDLLQEVNKVIWEKYAEFEPGSNLSAWAYRIAYFEALKYRKNKGRDRLRFGDDTIEILAREADKVVEQEPRTHQALLQCIEKLGPDDQRLIRRRYLAEHDIATLAQELGRSDKSIYRSLARIRALLLDCVQKTMALEAI